jgi:hypothetical protein
MYFRIIVKQPGEFAFRTSKITDPQQMVATLKGIRAGFPAAEGFTVEVLRAAPSSGELLSDEQVSALVEPAGGID